MTQVDSNFTHTIVFADGACSGNPGPGGWGAIVVTPDGKVWELGRGAPETTNNRMELVAVIQALESLKDHPSPVGIYTDSSYVIRGINEWIWGWKRRGWKTAAGDDVANKDLWEWLLNVVSARKGSSAATWHYVRGHSGVPGNERVDEIAVGFTKGPKPQLYQGNLLNYGVAIHDIPADTSLPPMRERTVKQAALCYLSLVDGKLSRHSTWAECEKVVKGRSGAKFKKATSSDDVVSILAGWGYAPEDLD